MRILADEAIWGVPELFSDLGEVRTFAGRDLSPALVADADALIVRSISPVNTQLLAGSRVKFVGTASAGTEHVDTAWLAAQGIHFASAAGCNARTVAEYVLAALLVLAQRLGFDLATKTLGVVGVGHVGSIVADWCRALGMSVLLCDPPRQRALSEPEAPAPDNPLEPEARAPGLPLHRAGIRPGGAHDRSQGREPLVNAPKAPQAPEGRQTQERGIGALASSPSTGSGASSLFVDPPTLLAAADIITLHVPLTRHVPDATWRMAGEKWFSACKHGAFFFNTARGDVVDEAALSAALAAQRIAGAVLDVWQDEPRINRALVEKVDIATPHVAGYSFEARQRAAKMMRAAIVSFIAYPTPDPPRRRVPNGAANPSPERQRGVDSVAPHNSGAPRDPDTQFSPEGALDRSQGRKPLVDNPKKVQAPEERRIQSPMAECIRQYPSMEIDPPDDPWPALREFVLRACDVLEMDQLLRKSLMDDRGRTFDDLRKHYSARREFGSHPFSAKNVSEWTRSLLSHFGCPAGREYP